MTPAWLFVMFFGAAFTLAGLLLGVWALCKSAALADEERAVVPVIDDAEIDRVLDEPLARLREDVARRRASRRCVSRR